MKGTIETDAEALSLHNRMSEMFAAYLDESEDDAEDDCDDAEDDCDDDYDGDEEEDRDEDLYFGKEEENEWQWTYLCILNNESHVHLAGSGSEQCST